MVYIDIYDDGEYAGKYEAPTLRDARALIRKDIQILLEARKKYGHRYTYIVKGHGKGTWKMTTTI